MSISPAEAARFERCCREALLHERVRAGIGTLGERTLHVILKHYFDPDPAHHEQKIGRYVADIFDGSAVTEIQTRSFASMRKKLAAFTPRYPVNIVYPIAAVRHITWVEPHTGELSARRKSPKAGRPWDALLELYALRPMMPLENVTFTLVICEMDEFRLKNGWGKDHKRGGARCERIPTALTDIIPLREPRDTLALLPDVPETFTSAEFAKAAHLTRGTAGKALQTLVSLGTLEIHDKKGNAYIYKRKEF